MAKEHVYTPPLESIHYWPGPRYPDRPSRIFLPGPTTIPFTPSLCPALPFCGERDRAGSIRRYNRRWSREAGLPIFWVPGRGTTPTATVPRRSTAP